MVHLLLFVQSLSTLALAFPVCFINLVFYERLYMVYLILGTFDFLKFSSFNFF